MASSQAAASIAATSGAHDTRRWTWLPKAGTWKYHALLLALGILVLGPLGGVTASYMNFSLGFFIGGQVLAGILGSTVTYGYGAEGKHGANYIQTAAASVASLSAMGVLIQAMVWMGLPQPPVHALASGGTVERERPANQRDRWRAIRGRLGFRSSRSARNRNQLID